VFKEWYNLSKTTFLIARKNAQIEQIIGFVKFVFGYKSSNIYPFDESVKYGCFNPKISHVLQEICMKNGSYCHVT
jgi:hypothetical protein